MRRLSSVTVGFVRNTDLPAYDRATPPPMVHLGVGAFARAHLAVYAEDLLRAGWPATIAGISLRSADAEERLAPQDGLYTVSEREPDRAPATRLVGSITSVATGADAAVRAIASPDTRFVSLTVTEKGYESDGDASVSVVVTAGLEQRRRTGGPPVIVASLDNLADNGSVLQRAVLERAEELDRTLPSWIEAQVRFPRSVVDRMVPAATEADLDEVAARLGLVDRAAVVAEQHRSWVLEAGVDIEGAPPLADVGVEVVTDVDAHQRRKLWLLNGPHSTLAYAGLLAGRDTIAAASADPLVGGFVRQYVDDVLQVSEAGPVAAAYADLALRRFRNPALGHTCMQVGADGSRKLPQRILPVMAARQQRGLSTQRQATVVAIWLASVAEATVAGRILPNVEDPAADELRRALADGGTTQVVERAVGPDHASSVPVIVAAFDEVTRRGVRALEETG